MASISAAFTAADLNADGVLDASEWESFMGALQAADGAKGAFVDTRPDVNGKAFTAVDEFNAATPGVSLQDFFMVMGIWMVKYEGFKAEL